MATASWIDRSDCSMSSPVTWLLHLTPLDDLDDFSFTTATSVRRVWDPGIGIDPTDNDTTASELRLTVVVVVVVVEVLTQSVHPTADHDFDDFLPLNMTMAMVARNESIDQPRAVMSVSVCGRHIQLIVLQMLGWMSSYVYQRPASRFLHQSSLPWIDQVPSLFHYSHPVLSRPTVPNI